MPSASSFFFAIAADKEAAAAAERSSSFCLSASSSSALSRRASAFARCASCFAAISSFDCGSANVCTPASFRRPRRSMSQCKARCRRPTYMSFESMNWARRASSASSRVPSNVPTAPCPPMPRPVCACNGTCRMEHSSSLSTRRSTSCSRPADEATRRRSISMSSLSFAVARMLLSIGSISPERTAHATKATKTGRRSSRPRPETRLTTVFDRRGSSSVPSKPAPCDWITASRAVRR
mmetsp:Transcript_1372/g.3535  ORF Transcript_1372/g.3535 Transcript_1372/m.3535 type:complete len:237 (+) Transcript_1372:1137-1847(+)